jgi:hypothetical protein
MAKPERRGLVKAPAVDVIGSITQPAVSGAGEQPSTSPAPPALPTPETPTRAKPSVPQALRRGPGRPKRRRRMEPFSSKIEFELRDQVNAYLVEHDMTMVDFIDESFRDRLAK